MPINIPDDTPKDQANKSIFAGVRDSGGSTLFAPFRAAVVTTLNGIATAALETYDATIAAVLGSKADAGNRSMMKTLDDIESVIGATDDGYQPGATATTSLTQSLRGTLHWLSVIQPAIGITNSSPSSNFTAPSSLQQLIRRIGETGEAALSQLGAIHGGISTLVESEIEPVDAGRAYVVEATGAMVWQGHDNATIHARYGLYYDDSNELGGEWMGAFGAGLLNVSGGVTELDHSQWTTERKIFYIPMWHFTRIMINVRNNMNVANVSIEISLASFLGSAYEIGTPYGNPSPTAERYHKLVLPTQTVVGSGGAKAFGNSKELDGTLGYVYLDALAGGWMYVRLEITPSGDPTSGDLQLLIVRS